MKDEPELTKRQRSIIVTIGKLHKYARPSFRVDVAVKRILEECGQVTLYLDRTGHMLNHVRAAVIILSSGGSLADIQRKVMDADPMSKAMWNSLDHLCTLAMTYCSSLFMCDDEGEAERMFRVGNTDPQDIVTEAGEIVSKACVIYQECLNAGHIAQAEIDRVSDDLLAWYEVNKDRMSLHPGIYSDKLDKKIESSGSVVLAAILAINDGSVEAGPITPLLKEWLDRSLEIHPLLGSHQVEDGLKEHATPKTLDFLKVLAGKLD